MINCVEKERDGHGVREEVCVANERGGARPLLETCTRDILLQEHGETPGSDHFCPATAANDLPLVLSHTHTHTRYS